MGVRKISRREIALVGLSVLFTLAYGSVTSDNAALNVLKNEIRGLNDRMPPEGKFMEVASGEKLRGDLQTTLTTTVQPTIQAEKERIDRLEETVRTTNEHFTRQVTDLQGRLTNEADHRISAFGNEIGSLKDRLALREAQIEAFRFALVPKGRQVVIQVPVDRVETLKSFFGEGFEFPEGRKPASAPDKNGLVTLTVRAKREPLAAKP